MCHVRYRGAVGDVIMKTVFLLVLVSPATGAAREGNLSIDGEVAMTVNQHAIAMDEFQWFMEQERAGVFADCKARCNLEDGPRFWDQDCEGTTPRKMLLQRTINRVTQEKIEQIEFQELGLISDCRYSSFLEYLAKSNREREQAVKDGHVVYGPVQYTQLQFYGHWMASLRIQAKAKVARGTLALTEQSLRSYYYENRNQFKSTPTTSLEMITIQTIAGSDSGNGMARLKSVAQEIASRLDSGQVPEHVVRVYAGRADITLSQRRFDHLDNDRIGELFAGSENATKVLALAPGQSAVIILDGHSLEVVQCGSKTGGDYLPFEMVKDRVKARCLDGQYGQLLRCKVQAADVQVNQRAVDLLLPP